MRKQTQRTFDLDQYDLKIITILQTNARVSIRSLARAVGLSRSAIHDRQQRLEHSGLILGYQAVIAPSALGPGTVVLMRLSLGSTEPPVLARFVSEITANRLIVAMSRLQSSGSFLIEALSHDTVLWVEQAIARHALTVVAFEVDFVLKEVVGRRPPPVGMLPNVAQVVTRISRRRVSQKAPE